MDFELSERATDLVSSIREFVGQRIVPIEQGLAAGYAGGSEAADKASARLRLIQAEAKQQGLWNLFLPAGEGDSAATRFGTRGGRGLTNLEYAPVAEEMGRSLLAPLIFNCNAPDTGNMELLLKYGDEIQRRRWLDPLLAGEIRSAFLMTEPAVASSDATTMQATVDLHDHEVVLNGRKWWSTGAVNPDCRVAIFMGRSHPNAPRHSQHTMVLVPMDAPGLVVRRKLSALGQFDEPLGHAEITLEDVRLPNSSVLGSPGQAFALAQGRLGPGRVHHCMRLIGLAEVALELACERAVSRRAFGRRLSELGSNAHRLAEAAIAIEQARLLVLHAAWKLDRSGPRSAIREVSQIKAVVPRMACEVIDLAIQIHGGAGMSQDLPLAAAYAAARSLRIADGPDEVHLETVARHLLRPFMESQAPGSPRAGAMGRTPDDPRLDAPSAAGAMRR